MWTLRRHSTIQWRTHAIHALISALPALISRRSTTSASRSAGTCSTRPTIPRGSKSGAFRRSDSSQGSRSSTAGNSPRTAIRTRRTMTLARVAASGPAGHQLMAGLAPNSDVWSAGIQKALCHGIPAPSTMAVLGSATALRMLNAQTTSVSRLGKTPGPACPVIRSAPATIRIRTMMDHAKGAKIGHFARTMIARTRRSRASLNLTPEKSQWNTICKHLLE